MKGKDAFGGAIVEPPKNTPTLADMGIGKKLSSRAQEKNKGMAGGAKRTTSGTFEAPLDNAPTLADMGNCNETLHTQPLS